MMDPILAILLISALAAFFMALIWSATKPKRSEPIVEPVENKPLPPIDDQIFDDILAPPPVIVENTFEEEIVEDESDEPVEVEENPEPNTAEDPVLEEVSTEVNENFDFEFEEETKKTESVYEPEPPSNDSGSSDFGSSDSGSWSDSSDDGSW